MIGRKLPGLQVLVLTSLLLLMGCNPDEPAHLQVTPGERIGQIALGASRAQVLEELGQPLQGRSEQVADTLHRDEWPINAAVIISALFHEDRVIQVQVDGPGYVAPGDVSGYSSISEIRSAYPNLEVSVMAHDMENMYMDDVEKGIAFSIRGANEGELTNEDGDVINVYVHPAGKEVIATVHHHEEHQH